MKTTLEIPDPVFRRAKSVAAAQGIPLREFVTQAVQSKVGAEAPAVEKPWLKHMGKLKRLHKETLRINRLIAEDSDDSTGDAASGAGLRPGRNPKQNNTNATQSQRTKKGTFLTR